MTKQDFMEQLIEELYRYFSPEQYQLEGSVLLKNNDTKRYAILLKKNRRDGITYNLSGQFLL